MSLAADSPIQYLKGVGPQRAQLFATLGIRTVHDLLHYFPFRHEEEQGETDIEDIEPGKTCTIRGEVVRIGGRPPSRRAELDDGTGQVTLRWFQMPYGGKGLYVGAHVLAKGRVQVYGDRAEIVQPAITILHPAAPLQNSGSGRRLVGVYRANLHIKSALIRRVVQNALVVPRLPVAEFLPRALLARHGFPEREQAVRHMHQPPSPAALDEARRRLAYEEFLLMELAMALRRRKRRALQRGVRLPCTPEIDARIRARFPFELTAAQNEAVQEIAADLAGGRPMTRLLQGDVGSGKTVVALYACLVAIANRRQAAIMAPTEILAAQHLASIERYLMDSRVRYVLLRGGMNRSARADALAAIERGEIDLVVGTQALIQKDVAFHQLALVVVDEQHKFGVLQRHEFRTKGPMPHYLVMTATPIPRTLAMTVFGDLDVSLVRASPPGRGRIITKVVTLSQWRTVMEYVRGRLEAGEQAYVVCPVIGERAAQPGRNGADADGAAEAGDPVESSGMRREGAGTERGGAGKSELLSVREAWQHLVDGPWSGLNVGLLHGGLRSAAKSAVIEAFGAGRLHALVSTTVVEVGIDVPNATIMVVEHAERYGLSQLHQLRGRVGRGSRDSLCVLIAHGGGPKAAERLDVMVQTTDGFRIAEADLQQRGPGQLFGTRQHGLPELTVASIVDDFGLLEQARQDAFALVAADPQLTHPDHAALRPALQRMFGEKLALIDAA